MSERPIGVRLRGDLQVSHQHRDGLDRAVIKDPHSLRFFEMAWDDYQLATVIEPGATASQIAARWQRTFPGLCAGHDTATISRRAERLCTVMRQLKLVEQSGAVRPALAALTWGRWLTRLCKRISAPMFVRGRLFDPDALLEDVVRRWQPLFSTPALVVAALFVFVTLLSAIGHLDEMQFNPGWFSSWQHLAALYLGIVVLKLIHESGHALVCKALGGHVHEVGAQLLVFHPTFFVDVSDTWMWPDKGRRIAVAAAGFCAEMVAAAVLFWYWRLLSPGFGRDLCLNLMFIASVSAVLFNANPLMRYDGYHMLADFLREPRLRQKAFAALAGSIRRLFFGARVVPTVREPRKAIFIIYALLSSAYLGWIVFVVGGFLSRMFEPLGLEVLGQVLLGSWMVSIVLPVLRFSGGLLRETASLPPHSRPRALVCWGVVSVGASFLAMVPVPVRVERECVVEVSAPGVVRASQPGFLGEVLVREGDFVKTGQLLARMENRQLSRESTAAALEVGLRKVALLSAVGDNASGSVQKSLRQFNEARARAAESASRSEGLALVSACDGVVLSSHLERKQGRFLHQGEELLSIAGKSVREVMLPLTEKEALRVQEGAPVEFRVKAFPGKRFMGRISTAPLRTSGEEIPRALTSASGGSVALDPSGKIFASQVTHLSRFTIKTTDRRLRPGLTGRARITCGHLPAAQWLLREILDAIDLHHRL